MIGLEISKDKVVFPTDVKEILDRLCRITSVDPSLVRHNGCVELLAGTEVVLSHGTRSDESEQVLREGKSSEGTKEKPSSTVANEGHQD